MARQKTILTYVTSNDFKAQESRVFVDKCLLPGGTRVGDLYQFNIRKVPIPEMLEVDIEKMVRAEVTSAYSRIRVPCIVEHAGLVFDQYKGRSYPGGLTKPMWDCLAGDFLTETHSAGRTVIARAVVGYCDGKQVRCFVGETTGKLANQPKGSREFYWDTVFIPDDPTNRSQGKTYAEIIDDPALGLEYKVVNLSQSSQAMKSLLQFLQTSPACDLWS
jgi:XTP/dITP diphosphohydrolase